MRIGPWPQGTRQLPAAIACVALALSPAFVPSPARADLGPALRARLAHSTVVAQVPVLVALRRQVDTARFRNRPDALVRTLKLTARTSQEPLLRRLPTRARRFWLANALAVRVTPAEVRKLARDPAVERVDLDEQARAQDLLGGLPPATTPGAGNYGVQAVGAPTVWAGGITGAGVVVGSIDTGVDPAAAGLQGKIAAWVDTVGGRPSPYDDNGHGTASIGTMVGSSPDGTPVGVAPGARAVVAKALGADGRGSESGLLAAAQWMTAPAGNPALRPAVVNNSWTSGDANDPWFRQMVRGWLALGMVPVFGAGNRGPGPQTIENPGSYPESLAVGAIDQQGNLPNFSARGPVVWRNPDGTGPAAGTTLTKPDLVAPGALVLSLVGTGYVWLSGTSQAAPHVVGVAALMRQANPALGGAIVEEILRRTATDLGPAGPDPGFGWGGLNAVTAVQSAAATPAPAPAAAPAPPSGPTAPAPAGGGAAARAPLTLYGVGSPASRRGPGLILRGEVAAPSQLRVVLAPSAGRKGRRASSATVLIHPASDEFRVVVSTRRLPRGRYRLTVQALSSRAGPPVASIVRVVRVTR